MLIKPPEPNEYNELLCQAAGVNRGHLEQGRPVFVHQRRLLVGWSTMPNDDNDDNDDANNEQFRPMR
jgi:hypothetical protein